MQLIIVLALVVIVGGLIGTGSLGEPVNNIKLWVQALGYGEGNIETPITTATIDLQLDVVPNENPEAPPVTIVTACAFHSDESIDLGTERSDGKLICKLLNEDGNAIAEGDIAITQYVASETVIILVNQPIFLGATNFDNVFDAMVIVQGPL